MNKSQLNAKQICALFIAICPLTKLITAPAVFSGYCEEKLWQPLILLFAIDFLLLFLCFLSRAFLQSSGHQCHGAQRSVPALGNYQKDL